MSDKTAIEIDDNGTAFFIKFGGGGYLQRKERLSFTEPDLSVHEHAICELAAEVRRLREREAKAREFVGMVVEANRVGLLDESEMRQQFSHWLAEGE